MVGRLGSGLTSDQIQTLIELLGDPDVDVRGSAATAVGRLGSQLTSDQIQNLIDLLGDLNGFVWRCAG